MGAVVCRSAHWLVRRITRTAGLAFLAGLAIWPAEFRSAAQTITIDAAPSARHQTIDGFGTCLSGNEGQQDWWRSLYFDDLQSSMLRVDLTPTFKSPYS